MISRFCQCRCCRCSGCPAGKKPASGLKILSVSFFVCLFFRWGTERGGGWGWGISCRFSFICFFGGGGWWWGGGGEGGLVACLRRILSTFFSSSNIYIEREILKKKKKTFVCGACL